MKVIAKAIPQSEQAAKQIAQKVNQEVVAAVEKMAHEWIGESKLIHAGAALRLAKTLKEQCESK